MSKRDVLAVAFKIMGVFFLLQGAMALLPLTGILIQGDSDLGVIAAIGIGWAIFLGAALLLITRSDGLAARLVGREADEPRPAAVDMWGLQYVGFSVLGLFFALRGLGLTLGLLPQVLDTVRGYAGPSWWSFLGPIVMLLIGLRLLFGAQLLVDLVKRARNAGHPQGESESD